jgi:hypothetical protein
MHLRIWLLRINEIGCCFYKSHVATSCCCCLPGETFTIKPIPDNQILPWAAGTVTGMCFLLESHMPILLAHLRVSCGLRDHCSLVWSLLQQLVGTHPCVAVCLSHLLPNSAKGCQLYQVMLADQILACSRGGGMLPLAVSVNAGRDTGLPSTNTLAACGAVGFYQAPSGSHPASDFLRYSVHSFIPT